ncbi:hypothetical protein [Sphingomonas crusticola]|uniref:hypothetical protein n=1 Tax=Sphingomonas crusticola TaxID=1697973 RepID=UPI0013C2B119|nr:hypothetical protein [Sphingomonas crusticola]
MMAMTGRYISGAGGLALLVSLSGCGSDTSMQHTNATTTEQLNQIADNTSSTAGADQTRDGSAADIAAQSTRPSKPRRY